jgi:hypothetical protein
LPIVEAKEEYCSILWPGTQYNLLVIYLCFRGSDNLKLPGRKNLYHEVGIDPFETIMKVHILHGFHPGRQHSSEAAQWKYEVPLLWVMFSFGSDDANIVP